MYEILMNRLADWAERATTILFSKRQERKREKELKTEFDRLPKDEISILLYMKSLPVDVAWLPSDDVAALSLLDKQLIRKVMKDEVHRGMAFAGCYCFAFAISNAAKEILTHEVQPHNPKQNSHHLDIYQ